MNTIIAGLVIVYLVWYTIDYARIVWKDGNKFGGVFVALLALSLASIPLWLKLTE